MAVPVFLIMAAARSVQASAIAHTTKEHGKIKATEREIESIKRDAKALDVSQGVEREKQITTRLGIQASVAQTQMRYNDAQHERSVDLERRRIEKDEHIAIVDAQKETVLALVNMAQEVHTRKVDAILEIFRIAADLLSHQAHALTSERSDLTRLLLEGDFMEERDAIISRRKREIAAELEDVRDSIEEITAIAVRTVSTVSPELDLRSARIMTSNALAIEV